MARRIRKALWTRTFQRSLSAMTRAVLRAGKQATLKAGRQATAAAEKKAKPPPAKRTAAHSTSPARRAAKRAVKAAAQRRPPPAGGGLWSTGVATVAAGARRYRVYKPPGALAAERLPMVVLLHGCRQDAASLARSTRMQRLAARQRFFVLCPEQPRLAHPHGCWNWYATRSGRADAEAASIVAAIDQVCARYGADPHRVAIAGLSAGACMAALVALRHPDRVQAVVMHSGVAPGAAHSTASAIAAMQGRRKPVPLQVPSVPALPPLLVIQGSADRAVVARNGPAAAQWWAYAMGAHASAARTVQRGQRLPAEVTDFKLGVRTVVRLVMVKGLGHAWSGGAPGEPFGDPLGPDASRMVWAFAQKQFQGAG